MKDAIAQTHWTDVAASGANIEMYRMDDDYCLDVEGQQVAKTDHRDYAMGLYYFLKESSSNVIKVILDTAADDGPVEL